MYIQTLIPVRLQFVALVIVLTLVSSGCGVRRKHGLCRNGKNCVQEMYGVEDTICHGYEKTCWRSWNEDAWSNSGCPVNYNALPDSVIPAAPETGSIDTSVVLPAVE